MYAMDSADLVGTEYIHDIHVYGRTLGKSFLTIGGKVVHLSEVFSYVAFLQKSYGLTPDQLDKLAQLPEVGFFFLVEWRMFSVNY